MLGRSWQSREGPFSSSPQPRRAGSGVQSPDVLALMSPHPQVTMGIFMTLTEGINNSSGRCTSLM